MPEDAPRGTIRKSTFGRKTLAGRKDSSKASTVASEADAKDKEEDFFTSISFKEKRAMYVKGFVQMLTFFIFLGVFTITVLASQSPSQGRLAEHVKKHFTHGKFPLQNVRSIDDYWKYVEETFIPAFHSNNSEIDMAYTISPRLLPMDLNNRIVGGGRLWQVRVQNKTNCQVGNLFQNYQTDCFKPLMEYTQEKEPFGPYNKYEYSDESHGRSYQGLLSVYPAYGHTEPLQQNYTYNTLLIKELQENDWISAPTRAVFIDFTIWNMNNNLHAVTRIVAEFSMSGVCATNSRVIVVQPRHLNIIASSGLTDLIAIVGEFILALFILFYVAEELTEFSVTLLRYFTDPWNVMDWLNLALLIWFVVMRTMVWLEAMGFTLGSTEVMEKNHYTPMQSIAERLLFARTINAFNAVLIWAKVVKYVGFMPYVKTLLVTVETCWKQFFSFLIMFLIIFLAFVIAYTIGFGETIRELSTTGATGVYLARSFLGDIDLTNVYLEAPIFGAFLILFFMLGVYFLMMNVFFAILLAALDEARGKKQTDFRQEMLAQSVQQIKDAVKDFFSLERRIRHVAPGLWAQMYKKRRLKRKQEEKQRLLKEKQEKEENKRKIAHQTGLLQQQQQEGDTNSSASFGAEALDKRDILSAVENMAGKLLSKIQGLSFELTTEIRDLQSALTKMESYTARLSNKLENLYNDQVELLENQDF